MQSNNAWPHQLTGKTDTRFPTSWSYSYDFGTETPCTGSLCSYRGCLGFPEINTGLPPPPPQVSELHEVSCKGRTGSRSDSSVEWRSLLHHGSSQPFYFHGLGLTLVTHETACIPSIWKLLVFPKELRIKTYNSHGPLE
jgi:hypothetical protein